MKAGAALILFLLPLQSPSAGIWLHPRATDMPGQRMGPFVRLGDGAILTIDGTEAFWSRDEGKTWSERRPIFDGSGRFEIRPERALIRTRAGTVILAFINEKETANWAWNASISDSPDARAPTYTVRSLNDGKTWEPPTKLHDAWTGANRDMIETRAGKVVLTSMKMLHDPGRHSVLTYVSADEGESWRASHLIDLGGVGHHGGVSESTVVELKNGRLWQLIRTNWSRFWEAFSEDGGLSWRTIRPSSIEASSAPGMIKRLASGRLVLVWNRLYPEGKTSYPLRGGDNQWSEVPVSNHREELSIAFSNDDGRTWSKPVVIARHPKTWVSYPYVFEARPGALWITTMQGELRVALREQDFVK
jgi:sialidase-1